MIHPDVLHAQVRESSGWEYLLPCAARRRWLCLDATRGATTLLLAPLCDELVVIPESAAAAGDILEKLRVEGLANTRLAPRGAYPENPYGGEGFDGFILHDLGGVLGSRKVEEALRICGRLVAPRGFVYAALRNRYGYTRLRRGWSDIGQRKARSYFSASAVRRWMGDGCSTTLFPMISDGDGQLTDLVPPGGYVSAKNPSLTNERLRRFLLGPRGASRWSPGFAVVTTRDPTARNGIAHALDTLNLHGVLRTPDDPSSLVKRYHVVDGGKVILSVGEGPGRYGSHIVVLVRFSTYAERRRREASLLSRLATLPAAIANQIPRFFYEAKAGAAYVFVLQEFPGVTLDAPGAELRAATREAAQFLGRLHLATRRRVRMTPERLDAMFDPAFEIAHTRYPTLMGEIDRLEEGLKSALAGAELPLVWMHGDFKVENIVVDEHSQRLLGVIDWEHSEPEGLPLLDLWYLLLYNMQIEQQSDFLSVARKMLPLTFRGEDAALCAGYMGVLEIPQELVPALAGALVLHHITRRTYYDPNDVGVMEKLRALVGDVVIHTRVLERRLDE